MKQRTKVTEWPVVRVNVSPKTMEHLEAEAESRALSVAAVVRETLDRAYKPEPAEAR